MRQYCDIDTSQGENSSTPSGCLHFGWTRHHLVATLSPSGHVVVQESHSDQGISFVY